MASHKVSVADGKVCVSNLDAQATVRVYGVDGRLIAQAQDAGVVVADAGQYKGVAIVSVESAAGITNEKIYIK